MVDVENIQSGETDSNPYRCPMPSAARSVMVHTASVRVVSGMLLLVISVGLAVEAWHHESIVASGPILFCVGVALVVLSVRQRDRLACVVGVFSIALCVLVVGLVNGLGWGPEKGNMPITILAWCYAVLSVPPTLAMVLRSR